MPDLTLRKLEDRVATLERDLEAYRDGQKDKTRQLKRIQKRYQELTDFAYDPKTQWGDSQAARANRDGVLGPRRKELERQLELCPERINLTEVELIKARDALREYKAAPHFAKPRAAPKIVQPTVVKKAPRAEKMPLYERQFDEKTAREMDLRTEEGSHIEIKNNGWKVPNARKAQRAAIDGTRTTSRQSESEKRGRESRATSLGWKGTARPSNKRTAAALDDDDEEGVRAPKRQHLDEIDEEEERALKPPKKPETEADDRVLKEKSTNEDVAAARGRRLDGMKGKKRTRAASPSPSRAPVKKAARTKVSVDNSSDKKGAPKTDIPAKSAAIDKNAIPAADMTSGRKATTTPSSSTAPKANKETSSKTAGSYKVGKRSLADFQEGAKGVGRTTTKGTKRTAAWSVGDAVAPDAKRQKNGPSSGNVKAVGEVSEKTSTSGAQSTEKKTSDDDLEEGEIGEDGTTGKTANGGFKGIKNIGASCFSATVIQLIDAALAGHNIDRLLGKLVETEKFGITDDDCKKIEAKMTGLPEGISRKLKDVRKAVWNAAMQKDSNKVSVAKHLRKLLADLRDVDGEDNISAFRFQAVVSDGAGNNLTRNAMRGDSQEDVSEYFTAVLGALQKDPRIEDADDMARLFDIHTETSKRCRRLDCQYESATEEAKANHHVLSVQQEAKLSELFESSKHSVTDIDCPKCSKTKLIASTKFTRKPVSFVVAMNRVGYDKVRRTAVKNASLIQIDTHELEIGDAEYRLDAVIMHKGRSGSAGHYTIFRKQGEDWYKIDDSVVIKVSADAVTDSKDGQTAMLLFKRQYS